MSPVNMKPNTNIDLLVESNIKHPIFQVNNHLQI